MDIQHKARLLGSHWLLRGLSASDIDDLAKYSSVRNFSKDSVIFGKEDESDEMMVVVSGRVRISSTSSKGKELILSTMFPGDLFGEIGMLDGGPRTADAIAEEGSQILIIRRAQFMPVVARNPDFSVKLLQVVCSRLRRTSEQAESLAHYGVRNRLAKALIHFASKDGEPSPIEGPHIIRMPQSDFAAMIGTTREAVNKQLRQWEDQGIIALKRGNVTVKALSELLNITET